MRFYRPSIDHGILSPSGKISKRAREAVLKRMHEELFPEGGLPHPTAKQPAYKQTLLRKAKQLRELAARGMSPRKYAREAARLEAEAAKL